MRCDWRDRRFPSPVRLALNINPELTSVIISETSIANLIHIKGFVAFGFIKRLEKEGNHVLCETI